MAAIKTRELADETFLPSESQEQARAAEFISGMLAKHAAAKTAAAKQARLVDADGNEVVLPHAMFGALAQIAEAMKAGLAVTVAPHHLLLSTQEAADLLRVSRTTLVRLLEGGVIAFEKPGRHRKVRLSDLLEYRRRQRHLADQALSDMVADSERLGFYDEDPDAVRRSLKAARHSAAAGSSRASTRPTE